MESIEIFIDLIDFYGVPAILIEESFSKMWREIGLSLDRSGLVVTDQNRDKGSICNCYRYHRG